MKRLDPVTMAIFATIIVAAFIAIYVLQGIGVMSEVAAEFKGALIAAFSLILSYYFGSSKGSRDKDEKK